MAVQERSVRPGVFISHRTADADLARKLAEEIKRAGYLKAWPDDGSGARTIRSASRSIPSQPGMAATAFLTRNPEPRKHLDER